MTRWWTPLVLVVLFSLVLVWMGRMGWDGRTGTVSWSELKQLVAQGQIEEVVIGRDSVRALRELDDGRMQALDVPRVPDDESFVPLLEQYGVPYRGEPPNPCGDGSLLLFLPLLLLAELWMFVGRQGADARGVAAFGRSSASLVPEEGTGVTFDDVA